MIGGLNMKTIKAYYTDMELWTHTIEMQVPENASDDVIEQKVKEKVFEEAVFDYGWKDEK